MHQYGSAAQHCSAALDLDTRNVRALLNRAKALIERREFQGIQEARADLNRVKELDPANQETPRLQGYMQDLISKDKKNDKVFFARMFS
eukprot:gene15211-21288_t